MNVVFQQICEHANSESIDTAVDVIVDDLLRTTRSFGWPVPLERIAGRLGVVQIEYRSIPCDGVLIPLSKNHYRVYVSKDAPAGRQRFSLAHEIGHAVIHSIVPETRGWETRSVFTPIGSEFEEGLADLIASRLLFPTSLLNVFANQNRFCLRTIQELARIANASLSASGKRLFQVFKKQAALVVVDEVANLQPKVRRVLATDDSRRVRVREGAQLKKSGLVASSIGYGKNEKGLDWIPSSATVRTLRLVESHGWKSQRGTGGALVLVMGNHKDCESGG